MKQLIGVNKSYKFIFIGYGDLKNKFVKLCNKEKLSDNIIFVDYTDNPEEFYSAMDLFLFPSLHEGFGISVIEANCSGIVSICSQGVPKETNILRINKYVSLKKQDLWIREIQNFTTYNRESLFKSVSHTIYNIDNCINKLQYIYTNYSNFK